MALCQLGQLGELLGPSRFGFPLGPARHGAALAGERVDVGGLVAAFSYRVDRARSVCCLPSDVDPLAG